VTWAEVGELAKNFSGALSSALVFLESQHPILPLNPRLRGELSVVSAILAAVAGFGAHRYAKTYGRLRLGWVFLTLAVASLMVIIWLSGDETMSAYFVSLSARWFYVLFYVFLGGAIGGLLR
jgi:hypothetical protein